MNRLGRRSWSRAMAAAFVAISLVDAGCNGYRRGAPPRAAVVAKVVDVVPGRPVAQG